MNLASLLKQREQIGLPIPLSQIPSVVDRQAKDRAEIANLLAQQRFYMYQSTMTPYIIDTLEEINTRLRELKYPDIQKEEQAKRQEERRKRIYTKYLPSMGGRIWSSK